MALTVCKTKGCPALVERGHCPTHAREADRARGTPTERGYGAEHTRLRRDWQRRLDAGELVRCARCNMPIAPDGAWALDHDDDRTGYVGPSHSTCNNRAGGLAAHR